MREGPDFVFWFIKWGTAVVVAVVAVAVALFWLLKRWSDRQTAAHDKVQRERAGASRRP